MKKYLSVILAVLLAISVSACGVNRPAEREDPEIPEVSENPDAAEEKEPEKTEEPIDFGRKEVSAENFEGAVEIVSALGEIFLFHVKEHVRRNFKISGDNGNQCYIRVSKTIFPAADTLERYP